MLASVRVNQTASETSVLFWSFATAAAEPSAPPAPYTDVDPALVESIWVDWSLRVVNKRWRVRLNSLPRRLALPEPTYTTVVNATIAADGTLVDVVVTHSSGIEALDNTVLDAFRDVPRFDPPPASLLGPDGRAQLVNKAFQIYDQSPPGEPIEDPIRYFTAGKPPPSE